MIRDISLPMWVAGAVALVLTHKRPVLTPNSTGRFVILE